MGEHSFDIVSNVDLQEVSNAIQQAMKEIGQRYDFKGSKSSIELDKGNNEMTIVSDDEYKLKSVVDILESKLIKRKVPIKALNYGTIESALSGTVKQVVKLQQGIPTEKGKEIAKIIKTAKLKVQAEIQKDQLRVKGKDIDNLQSTISMLKEKDLGIHVDFVNFR
ncbi:MAG TPA: YajQ family cyclic di-GMP-binding protein [Nitrospirae bacterium]|nr:putative nucleotide-binding protein [bacterium BMS3Abin09]GBE40255.1 putative nucleotide-binding protein [bacterium BMS3Bbin09]HDH34291.1 YajQ family cyclic di-GMP-binding protein [Nitrospirota bacterium]HDO66642.1 YajQ family cyclic di-GMP-binding protein [Nitrospirota bacterium]HDZ83906.1 YajQ family cyclic di-GMP-binding protein [Nitrospirota bacterium]